MINNAILRLILRGNKRFHNTHLGESCFVIGNGSSLNFMDLTVFRDKPVIAINNLFMHKDSEALNIKYVSMPEPFGLYPTIRNTYNGKYQKNVLGLMALGEMRSKEKVVWFTSISNLPTTIHLNNCFYHHHFGAKTIDQNLFDLAGQFSFVRGGMYSAVGIARYMGFSKIYFVGCDYLHKPTFGGHFYTKAVNSEGDQECVYADLLSCVEPYIEMKLITPRAEAAWIETIQYEDWAGKAPEYRENTEIVSSSILGRLDEAVQLGQLTNPVYY